MVLPLAIGLAALALTFVISRYWLEHTSRDMGTMSRQWVAEYNASHP